jgi:hypothetical protein
VDGKAPTPTETVRAAAFQRSIRTAELKDAGGGQAAEEARNLQVLALAGWGAGSVSSGDPQPAGPAEAKAAVAALEPVVAELLARIERVLRAELSASATGPQSLHLDLGGAIAGLHALTVTITETTLDVTLTRGEGEAPEQLVLAARELAERLHQRFGKRTVRVLDAVGGEAAAETEGAGGMQAISRILGGPATRS